MLVSCSGIAFFFVVVWSVLFAVSTIRANLPDLETAEINTENDTADADPAAGSPVPQGDLEEHDTELSPSSSLLDNLLMDDLNDYPLRGIEPGTGDTQS